MLIHISESAVSHCF